MLLMASARDRAQGQGGGEDPCAVFPADVPRSFCMNGAAKTTTSSDVVCHQVMMYMHSAMEGAFLYCTYLAVSLKDIICWPARHTCTVGMTLGGKHGCSMRESGPGVQQRRSCRVRTRRTLEQRMWVPRGTGASMSMSLCEHATGGVLAGGLRLSTSLRRKDITTTTKP